MNAPMTHTPPSLSLLFWGVSLARVLFQGVDFRRPRVWHHEPERDGGLGREPAPEVAGGARRPAHAARRAVVHGWQRGGRGAPRVGLLRRRRHCPPARGRPAARREAVKGTRRGPRRRGRKSGLLICRDSWGASSCGASWRSGGTGNSPRCVCASEREGGREGEREGVS